MMPFVDGRMRMRNVCVCVCVCVMCFRSVYHFIMCKWCWYDIVIFLLLHCVSQIMFTTMLLSHLYD